MINDEDVSWLNKEFWDKYALVEGVTRLCPECNNVIVPVDMKRCCLCSIKTGNRREIFG